MLLKCFVSDKLWTLCWILSLYTYPSAILKSFTVSLFIQIQDPLHVHAPNSFLTAWRSSVRGHRFSLHYCSFITFYIQCKMKKATLLGPFCLVRQGLAGSWERGGNTPRTRRQSICSAIKVKNISEKCVCVVVNMHLGTLLVLDICHAVFLPQKFPKENEIRSFRYPKEKNTHREGASEKVTERNLMDRWREREMVKMESCLSSHSKRGKERVCSLGCLHPVNCRLIGTSSVG